jgi:predicted ATPase/tRNA A-37 threonylcarbamoyl transferase component Bud32
MSAAPGTRIGPYEVIELLGAGGMGSVYRVLDTRLGRDVALKFLADEFTQSQAAIERFSREARAASALNHPNIVTIYDIGEADAGRYIAMELVRGRTLRALASQAVAFASFLPIALQTARALAIAHAAGIVHRDIKPENVMLRDDGYVKVLDFGLARLGPATFAETATTTATGPGVLLGSLRYMSPEQARGGVVESASDIFSLGILFYELATGHHPFAAESPLATVNAILSRAPVPPARLNPELPGDLDALIMQMLEPEPRLRPTAVECVVRLERLAAPRVSVETAPVVARTVRRSVGRSREQAELQAAFEQAMLGSGLLMGVAGEPGIGKTTVVEDFLAALSASGRPCRIARGRCSERLAGTGAYLPFLEVLDNLLHGESGQSAASTMKLLAPAWYLQLVPLPADDQSAVRLRTEAQSGSQERLKRELAAFLLEVSRQTPLVLFLEDVHWADVSTVDLLAYLARQFEAMRLLVVATYRPSDLLMARHPFLAIKLELQARGLCRELGLEFLTRRDIDDFLALEFPHHRFPPELGELIHGKTEGSPLFMVELVRYLRNRQVIARDGDGYVLAQAIPDVEREMPESVRSMIQKKIDVLEDTDRRLLVMASVQGYRFDSAVVARALEMDPGEVEERLDALERVHAFVQCVRERELPDRTLSIRYHFVHILYQHALYGSLRATRRAAMCGAVARTLESFYGERRAEIASELAPLFEAARDASKAAEYFLTAARQAARLFANQEAVALAQRANTMLELLPESPERRQRELNTLMTMGMPLIATRGFANPDVERTYARAFELCRGIDEAAQTFPVLFGLWRFHISSGALPKARELGERLLALAQRTRDPDMLLNGHAASGITFVCLGDLAAGREQLERATASDRERQLGPNLDYGQDALSGTQLWLALPLAMQGEVESALDVERRALARAQAVSHPFSLAYGLQLAARVRQLIRDAPGAQQHAEAAIALSRQHGFAQLVAVGRIYLGWARSEQGETGAGLTEIREGLDAYRRIGAGLLTGHFLSLLADVSARAGDPATGLTALAEAAQSMAGQAGWLYEPELHRLEGELRLAVGAETEEAETCLRRAIAAARRQGARLLEIRSASSLGRLWQARGRRDEARGVLVESCAGFRPSNASDFEEAVALLRTLA